MIPVRGTGKTRLGEALPPESRRVVVAAMLEDVLAACAPWALRFVVTEDPVLADTASASGCTVVDDPGSGLNDAVAVATTHAIEAGATVVMVLPGDVPCVTPEDIAALLQREENVVVVPSSDGGTNALLRRPPEIIGPRFGPESARAHLRAARQADASFVELEIGSLALDVNEMADLQKLAAYEAPIASVEAARAVLGSV